MVNMNCPCCNSENLTKKERYNEFTLYRCDDCRVQFWTPLKAAGKEFYETSSFYPADRKKELEWRHLQFVKSPPISSGVLLDVACGIGEFLAAARNIGFDVWGVDISERQIEFAKRLYGLEHVFATTLDQFAARKDIPKFDVITFFEILEHMNDPRVFFRSVKHILSPNGIIAFSVPNTDRVGMGKEAQEKPPNHLFRWNSDSIRKFLTTEGFYPEKIKEEPFNALFFFTTGLFSCGVVKKISYGNNVPGKNVPAKKHPFNFLIRKAADLKNAVLLPAAHVLAIVPRLIGLKYWDLYVVAKLKQK